MARRSAASWGERVACLLMSRCCLIRSGTARAVTKGWPSVRETPRFRTYRIRGQLRQIQRRGNSLARKNSTGRRRFKNQKPKRHTFAPPECNEFDECNQMKKPNEETLQNRLNGFSAESRRCHFIEKMVCQPPANWGAPCHRRPLLFVTRMIPRKHRLSPVLPIAEPAGLA